MSGSSPQRDRQAPRTRLAGMGFELVGVVAACVLLGWWVDWHWQIQSHAGVIVGAMIGLVGGMYNFIREALAAVRKGQIEAREHRKRPPATPDERDERS